MPGAGLQHEEHVQPAQGDGAVDADDRASSAIHPASRMNIRYSVRIVTNPGSCQLSAPR